MLSWRNASPISPNSHAYLNLKHWTKNAMKLVDLTWHPYRIPFREPFITAHGALSHRTGAIICAQTEGEYLGNGEIAPLPEFHGADQTETLNELPRLAEELRGREITDILRFLEAQS